MCLVGVLFHGYYGHALQSKISINNPTPNAIVISISLSSIISGSFKTHNYSATITSAISPTMTTLISFIQDKWLL